MILGKFIIHYVLDIANDNNIYSMRISMHTSVRFSLAVIYAVFATANWAAPSIVAVVGPKWSMFGGGVAYW